MSMKKIFKIIICISRSVLFLLLLLMPLELMSQTQQIIVRTVLRPNRSIIYLEGVLVKIKGETKSFVSDSKGIVKIPMPQIKDGDTFYLSSVKKNGYELADNRTIGHAFTYSSKVPIEIVMINTKEKEEDVRRISDNSYRHAEKTYKQRKSRLEKQLGDKMISEALYHKQLQELQTWFEKYESLINSMAERYVSTDYATMDSLNTAVNIAIENGELEHADSLISTIDPMKNYINEKKKSEKRIKVSSDIIEKATTDFEEIKESQKRFADILYNKYLIYVFCAKNDSAAYCIQMRADLDTTNVDWQLDAGRFFYNNLLKPDSAMIFYRRALESALVLFGDSHPTVATIYNNIGDIYGCKGNYSMALQYHQKALALFKNIYPCNDFNLQTFIYNVYKDLINSSCDKEDLDFFMSDKVFTLTIDGNNTSEINGEYYLLEYSDWTYNSKDNIFNKVEKLADKPKDIVVMKDGVITKHHLKDTIGIKLGIKFVSKEEKQKIMEAYHKWKNE